jgi:hypothetical protein
MCFGHHRRLLVGMLFPKPAIGAGCSSVEADFWLVDDGLYVGYRRLALTSGRTLQNMYLDPLLALLEK